MAMPTLFLNHGGGPFPLLKPEAQGVGGEELTRFLRSVPTLSPKLAAPKSIVVVSAHYSSEKGILINSGESPELLFDYYGFPRAAYKYKYEARGNPALALRMQEMLEEKGIEATCDANRQWDHGVFIPLKLAYPDGNIPVVSISVNSKYDPKLHYAVGEALKPLRDDGVLIMASGSSFHNMAEFNPNRPAGQFVGQEFDEDLKKTCVLENSELRKEKLLQWDKLKDARFAHPLGGEDHFIPLLVAAGAAGEDVGRAVHSGGFAGAKITSFAFGRL